MKAILLALLLAAPAAPARAPAPDLSGVVDEALVPDANAARANAAKLTNAAAAEDASRAKLAAERKAAADELAAKTAELPTLKGTKKSLTQSRIDELSARVQSLDGSIAERVASATADRNKAAEQQSLAAALLAEDAVRKKQAKDAIAPDADLGGIPDARLRAAKAYLAIRLARAPKQVAAIEKEMERTDGTSNRAALLVAADNVRAEQGAEQELVQRIDDELHYRVDAKTEEAHAAENLARVAAAKAADEAEDKAAMSVTISTARSAAIDRRLDQIIADADAHTARVETTKSVALVALRTLVLLVFLAAGVAVVVYAVRRG